MRGHSQISERLYSSVTSGLAPEERISAALLLGSDALPEVLRGFLRLEFEIAVRTDLEFLTSHFELSENIREFAIGLTLASLAESSTLSGADAKRLLSAAVARTIAYLSTPRQAIFELLARDNDPILLDQTFFYLLQHVRGAYLHLPEILSAWASRKSANGATHCSIEELKQIIRTIDRAVVGNMNIDALIESLRPLDEISGQSGVDEALLVSFFREKGARAIVQSVERSGKQHVTLDDLGALVAAIVAENSKAQQSANKESEHDDTEEHDDSDEHDTNTYAAFLSELAEAGVVIAPVPETELLRSIEDEPSIPNDPQTPKPQ